MAEPQTYLFFLAGLAAGAVCVWLAVHAKLSQARKAVLAEAAAEKAVLEERLAAGRQQLETLKSAVQRAAVEVEQRRGEHAIETERRVKAEEKIKRIDELEARLAPAHKQITRLHGDNMALRAKVSEMNTRLEDEQRRTVEKQALLEKARHEMSDAFKALSADIFKSNSQSFLQLATATLRSFQEKSTHELEQRKTAIHELVRPLRESLQKVDDQIRDMEKTRAQAYAGLSEQVKAMAASQARLQGETANLVKSLRAPAARGRWGEIQLRRVVEMAGMVEYCDFMEQESTSGEQGLLRPDMVIKLPNRKNIVVDSKAVLLAYLEAQEAENDKIRQSKLKEHARHVRNHLTRLAGKGYWEQFHPSPEFVVLFLPGENFFSSALEQDPELIEFGVGQRVILATPTTLIAMLRAVSYGWRQERITEHAQAIGELGKTLYERLATLAGHFADLRKGLDRSVDSFNKAVGSFEGRVMVTARKFKEIDPLLTKEIAPVDMLDKVARSPAE